MAKARDTIGVNAYSSTVRKVLNVDENGMPAGHSQGTYEVVLWNNQAVGTGATILGPTMNVDGYKRITFLVKTDAACTVYPEVSNDGVTWYNPKTVADADISNACSNETIAIMFNEHYSQYVRLVVKATAAANVTATMVAGG